MPVRTSKIPHWIPGRMALCLATALLALAIPSSVLATTFSGSGDQAVGPFYVSGGLTTASWTQSSSDYFTVDLVDTAGVDVDRLADNDTGASGSHVVQVDNLGPPAGYYMLQIHAAGSWTIRVGPAESVTAVIDAVSPSPSMVGQNVTFGGHGSDSPPHTIDAYQWRTGTAALSSSKSFSTDALPAGVHTVYFKVRCSSGAWSSEVSTTLRIGDAPDDDVTAVIDGVSPNPAMAGSPVSFFGHGTDSLHKLAAYQWRSSIDGVLTNSPSPTFTCSTLSVGTHTIYFKAACMNGVWSPEVSTTLTINGVPVPPAPDPPPPPAPTPTIRTNTGGVIRSWHKHGGSTYDANVVVILGSEPYRSYRRTFRLTSKTKYYWYKGYGSGGSIYTRVSAKTYWSRVKAKHGKYGFYRNIGILSKKVKGKWTGAAVYGGFPAS